MFANRTAAPSAIAAMAFALFWLIESAPSVAAQNNHLPTALVQGVVIDFGPTNGTPRDGIPARTVR